MLKIITGGYFQLHDEMLWRWSKQRGQKRKKCFDVDVPYEQQSDQHELNFTEMTTFSFRRGIETINTDVKTWTNI